MMKKLLTVLLLGAGVPVGLAFTPLGPFKAWQVAGIGYQLPGDIGGPMNLTECYRWNVTNITYAFDESFIKYFGTNGMKAVDEAFAILNALPPASRINLDDYPLDTRLHNFQAEAALLLDLKSHVLALLVEQLGLAQPERWTWALYDRRQITLPGGVVVTNYTVVKYNFDPYTLQPSSYVNGILYTYQIFEPLQPGNYADAIETPVGVSEKLSYSSLASGLPGIGTVFFGLSRDDVGGLKFLLSTNNLAVEDSLAGVSRAGPAQGVAFGWVPLGGTTNALTLASTSNFWSFLFTNLAAATNASNFVAVGIRGGVDKLHFQKVYYDSLLGQAFTPVTNQFYDNVIVSNRLVQQQLQRVVSAPDIVFIAEELGTDPDGFPVLVQRSGTANWHNNDAINGLAVQGGPGVIEGQVQLRFTTQLPYIINRNPGFIDENNPFWVGGAWASFDHTDAPPIIYPIYGGLTVDDLLNILGSTTPTSP